MKNDNYIILLFDRQNNMYFINKQPLPNFQSINDFSVQVTSDININDILDNIRIFKKDNATKTSEYIITKCRDLKLSSEIYCLSSFVKTLNKYKCQCSKDCEKIIPFKNGGCYNLPDIGLIKPVCFDNISLKIGSTSPFRVIDYIKKNKLVER